MIKYGGMKYEEGEKELLNLVMSYVDEADRHNIDTDSLYPEIEEIQEAIEQLALAIERGDYERGEF